jgi:hypothetical protein
MSSRLLRLAAIATAAGVLGPVRRRWSTIIVPLLVMLSFAAVQLGFAWQLAGKAGLR